MVLGGRCRGGLRRIGFLAWKIVGVFSASKLVSRVERRVGYHSPIGGCDNLV